MLSLVTEPFLNQWMEKSDHRKYFTVILHNSIGVGIELTTTGSAIGLAMDCATGPDY